MKKNLKNKIIVLVALLVVITLGVIVGSNIVLSPKNIFAMAVSNTVESLQKPILDTIDSSMSMLSQGTLTINSHIDGEQFGIKKINLENLQTIWSIKKNGLTSMYSGDVKLKMIEYDLMNAKLVADSKESKIYFTEQTMLDKWYMFDLSQLINSENVSYPEVLKRVLNMFKTAIKEEEIVKTEGVIVEDNNSNVSADRYTLKITKENKGRVVNNAFEYIANDEILCNMMYNMNNDELEALGQEIISKEEFLSKLNQYKQDVIASISNAEISIYLKGLNEFVKAQIDVQDESNAKADVSIVMLKGYAQITSELFNMSLTYGDTGYEMDAKLSYPSVQLLAVDQNNEYEDITLHVISQDNINATYYLEDTSSDMKIEGTYSCQKQQNKLKIEMSIKPFVHQVNIGEMNIALTNEETMVQAMEITKPSEYVSANNMSEEDITKLNGVLSVVLLYFAQQY